MCAWVLQQQMDLSQGQMGFRVTLSPSVAADLLFLVLFANENLGKGQSAGPWAFVEHEQQQLAWHQS